MRALASTSTIGLTVGLTAFAAAVAVGAVTPGAVMAPPCQSDADCEALAGPGRPALCVAVSAVRSECGLALPPAPSAELATTLALGRAEAASAAAWLRAVQFIGAPHSLKINYAGLEHWVDLITDLDPTFALAYQLGGILLASAPDRAEAADALLAKAERVLEDRDLLWQMALWRAFVAYFGMLDTERAAEHYRRAYELGGPEYARQRAETLTKGAATCAEVRAALAGAAQASQKGELGSGSSFLSQGQLTSMLINCYRQQLKAAEGSYRLAHGKGPESVQALVDDGRLEAIPPAPPGMCWMFKERKPEVLPCPN